MSTSDYDAPTRSSRLRFEEFELDVLDRQLWKGKQRLDVNARYMDALILLVSAESRLVVKDQFFSEVWHDVVVGDSALSQCIKELRRVLGDDAATPRFIQTVPRHGYRFVAPVEVIKVSDGSTLPVPGALPPWFSLTLGGSMGGALAGLFGGLLYGFSLSSPETGVGTLSTLLVLLGLNIVLGLTGAAGISAGSVAALWGKHGATIRGAGVGIAGAALGGLTVGTGAKMLGMDAFNLLFGRAPAGITGGPEGLALGIAVALGLWLGHRLPRVPETWQAASGAAVTGLFAGLVIPLLDGHLLGGSLKLLADSFQDSRLELNAFGALFGGVEFTLATETALAGIEGMIFCSCVAGAISWTHRRWK